MIPQSPNDLPQTTSGSNVDELKHQYGKPNRKRDVSQRAIELLTGDISRKPANNHGNIVANHGYPSNSGVEALAISTHQALSLPISSWGKQLLSEDRVTQLATEAKAVVAPVLEMQREVLQEVKTIVNIPRSLSSTFQNFSLPEATRECLKKFSTEIKQVLPAEFKSVSLQMSPAAQSQTVVDNLQLITGIAGTEAKIAVGEMLKKLPNFAEPLKEINDGLSKILTVKDFATQVMTDFKKEEPALANVNTILNTLGELKIPAVTKVVVYAQSSMQIYSSLELLKSGKFDSSSAGTLLTAISSIVPKNSFLGRLAGGAASGAAFGPVGMIAGAALGLLNSVLGIFGSNDGPDATEVIMNGIKQVSEQIVALHKAMEENFHENFAVQMQIINLIKDGFADLTAHLDSQLCHLSCQVGAMHEELRKKLDDLETTVCVGFAHSHQTQIQSLTQPLRDHLSTAQQIMSPTVHLSEEEFRTQLSKVNNKLAHWIKTESANEALTGAQLSIISPDQNASDTKMIMEFLRPPESPLDAARLNFTLGYLVANAGQYDQKVVAHAPTIPNPFLWFQAVDKYLELRKVFPNMFIDSNDAKELAAIIGEGEKYFTYFENLAAAENFWNGLFTEYYAILSAVDQAIKNFVQVASANIKTALDAKLDVAHTKNEQKLIAELNFLDHPDQFIAKFANRSMQNLEGEMKLTDWQDTLTEWQRVTGRNDSLRKQSLYTALAGHIAPTALAAECLGLVKFSAGQESSFEEKLRQEWCGWGQQDQVGRIHVPPAEAQKLRPSIEYMVHPYQAKNDNIEVLAQLLSSATRGWQLPLELYYHFDSKACPVSTIMQGSWTKLRPISLSYSTNKARDDTNTQNWLRCFYWPTHYSVPNSPFLILVDAAEQKKYFHHLSFFALNEWQCGEMKLASPTDVIPNDQVNAIKGKVYEYFLAARKEILNNLVDNQTTQKSAPEVQAAQQVYTLLDFLDFRVRLIQSYVHLMRPEKGTALDALFSKKKILAALKSYANSSTVTLDESPTAFLTKALDAKAQVSYKDIKEFKPMQVAPLHPLLLLHKGITRLKTYCRWRKVAMQMCPEFMQYIDIQRYQQECRIAKEDLFQHETYQWLMAIHAQKFTEAKGRLAHGSSARNFPFIPAGKYRDDYETIINWAMDQSIHPPFNDEKKTEALAERLSDLTNIKASNSKNNVLEQFVAYLENTTHNTWEKNVWLLQKIFYKYVPEAEQKRATMKIPCHSMWQDGVNALLMIINNHKKDEKEKIMEAALESVQKPNQKLSLQEKQKLLIDYRIKNLASCFEVGKHLQQTIYQVGLSKEFFAAIFHDYLDVLEGVRQFIDVNQNNNQQLTNQWMAAVFANPTTTEVHGIPGNVAWLLTKMKACMLLINQYVQMVFGYQLQTLERFQYLAASTLQPANFLALLTNEAQTHPNDKTLKGKIETYAAATQIFLEDIFYHIESAQDLVALQYYLENYFIKHPNSRVLRIDNTQGKLLRRGLSSAVLNLIDQYLSVNTDVTAVEFNNVIFNAAQLNHLVAILEGAPNIKSLGLIGAGLDAALFALLKPLMPQLTVLKVNSNNLGKGATESISDVLQTGSLTQLDLSQNALDYKGLGAVVSGISQHGSLETLSLSGNPNLFTGGIKDLAVLLSQHPKLTTLLLANTGLTSQQLVSLIDIYNLKNLKLASLKLLDISQNQVLNDESISYTGLAHLLKPMVELEKLIMLGTVNSTKTKDALSLILTLLLPKLVHLVLEEALGKDLQKLIIERHTQVGREAKLSDESVHNENQESKQECKAIQLVFTHHGKGTALSMSADRQIQAIQYDLTTHLRLGQPGLDNTLMRLAETIYLLDAERSKLCVQPTTGRVMTPAAVTIGATTASVVSTQSSSASSSIVSQAQISASLASLLSASVSAAISMSSSSVTTQVHVTSATRESCVTTPFAHATSANPS